MAPDDVHFGSVKENRGWYNVEYFPPLAGSRFSILLLSVVELRDTEAVAVAMEIEARAWLSRYPVPVMVRAFLPNESAISLEDVRPADCVRSWRDAGSGLPVLQWGLATNDTLPDVALYRDRLAEIFTDVPLTPRGEFPEAAARRRAVIKAGKWVVFGWLVIVPLALIAMEWWSDIVGYIVAAFAFAKAGIKGLRLSGYLPESKRQKEKEAEELQVRHHHYHCTRNPEAFARLRAENFQRDAIERTKTEAAALKVRDSSCGS